MRAPHASPGQAAPDRLLALDIDGTILDRQCSLRDVVRDAIRHVAAAGVHVVLATGRSPWHGVAGFAAQLGLVGPQITMQGALIHDPATGAIERARPLPPDVYREVLAFAEEQDLDPVVGTLDGHRATRPLPGVDFLPPVAASPTFRCVTDLAGLAEDELPMRVFLPTRPERHRRVRLAVTERFLGRAAVVWSDRTGVELLAAGTNKGEAIEWFAAARRIPLASVAAVGDAPNDTEMLRVAGRSAAMGSAPPEVRAAADVVVPASDLAGVVDALSWFYPDLVQVFGRRTWSGPEGVPA